MRMSVMAGRYPQTHIFDRTVGAGFVGGTLTPKAVHRYVITHFFLDRMVEALYL